MPHYSDLIPPHLSLIDFSEACVVASIVCSAVVFPLQCLELYDNIMALHGVLAGKLDRQCSSATSIFLDSAVNRHFTHTL